MQTEWNMCGVAHRIGIFCWSIETCGERFCKIDFLWKNERCSGGSSMCGSRAPYVHGRRWSIFLRVHEGKDKRTVKVSQAKTPQCLRRSTNQDICERTAVCTINALLRKETQREDVERTAGAIVETWEYADENCVFSLGEAVVAAVENTHVFRLWYVSMSMFFRFCVLRWQQKTQLRYWWIFNCFTWVQERALGDTRFGWIDAHVGFSMVE